LSPARRVGPLSFFVSRQGLGVFAVSLDATIYVYFPVSNTTAAL